ncbi:MAG: hypothetical protein ACI86C_000961 [Candidatus Latescibacterota bacterium]|jgi:hypothetical protein
MLSIRRLFEFYLNSSTHVGLAVSALVGVTVLEYDLNIPIALLFFLFFGTVTGYNFVKYAKIAKLYHHSLTDMLKTIQIFSFISFGLWVYFAFQLSIEVLLTVAIFGIFTFFYAVPVPFSRNLRTLSGLKIFLVSLVWAGVTVLVPMISASEVLDMDVCISFVQRIFLVIVLTLPFEIRDLQYDASKLKTLPQLFGLKNVKVFGIILLVITQCLEGFKHALRLDYFSCLLIICMVMGVALVVSSRKQSRYFASFFVESVPIVWYGFLLLFRNFLP